MKKKIFITISLILFAVAVLFPYKKIFWKEKNIELDPNYNELFSSEDLKEKGHISLAKEFITQDSIAYNNNDGSKTIYVYSSQINLINQYGFSQIDTRIINNKDTLMRENNYIYSVKNNDIKCYFNKKFNKEHGVLLKHDELSYEILTPDRYSYAKCFEENNFINNEKNMIIYENNSEVRFYPSSLGVECEIKFNNKGISTYKFYIKISDKNSYIKKEPGGYLAIYSESANGDSGIWGVIQSPLLKDRNGRIFYDSSVDTKKLNNNYYEITFTFNKNNVEKNSIAYISFEMRRDKQPDNALYSNIPNLVNAHLSNYSVIGNSDKYGIGRLLIRFNFNKYLKLNSEKIQDAYFYTYNLSNNDDEFEMLYVLEDWCSITGNWSHNYKIGGKASDIKNKNEMCFNIKEAVVKWCDDKENKLEHYGLMLKSKNEKGGKNNIVLTNDNALYKNKTEIILKKEK